MDSIPPTENDYIREHSERVPVDIQSEPRSSEPQVDREKTRSIGGATISVFETSYRPDMVESRPSLLSLALEPGEHLVGYPIRAVLTIPFNGREGVHMLPSTTTSIAAHLEGRIPSVFVDDGELQLMFRVANDSSATKAMVGRFSESLVEFLGLAEDTHVSILVESMDALKARISDLTRAELHRLGLYL